MKTKIDYDHGRFLIATTEVDYESYRDDYDAFCEEWNCKEKSEDNYCRWCENEARMNWKQDLENIQDCDGYNVPVKINGTLGLWWGRPEIKEVEERSVWDAIQRCLGKDVDDAVIRYNDGKIEVEAKHHDGTNCFTISRADGKRFKYLYAA